MQEPVLQRLRRVSQMGLSQLVYPGALHSRFNHVLGSMHLTARILDTFREKGVELNEDEYRTALLSALLHDVGHGPYSHALEGEWLPGMDHEELGRAITRRLNDKYEGRLSGVLETFSGRQSRPFFNQILSGHLDADRLDYLKRDSFYCGVPEGSLNIERLIRVFEIAEDRLVVLEKGIHSIEEFLMARRFMYWQVYLHKTSLLAELLLKKAIQRARILLNAGDDPGMSPALAFFLGLQEDSSPDMDEVFRNFLLLDDSDVIMALKSWVDSDDPLLKHLSRSLVFRRLPRIEWIESPEAPSDSSGRSLIEEGVRDWLDREGLSPEHLEEVLFTDSVQNTPYNNRIPELEVLLSSGGIARLSEVSQLFNKEILGRQSRRYFRVSPRLRGPGVRV